MKKKEEKTPARFVAVRELRYPDAETGEEVCKQPGEEVTGLAQSSLALELEAGNVEVIPTTPDPLD